MKFSFLRKASSVGVEADRIAQKLATATQLFHGVGHGLTFQRTVWHLHQRLGTSAQLGGAIVTIHAAKPHAIEVEATDFEMQCFSTLGADKAQGEDITDQVEQMWEVLHYAAWFGVSVMCSQATFIWMN
jgi:hypothetical protein